MRKTVLCIVASCFALLAFSQRMPINLTPSGEYMFAQRDTCQLFLSVYDPAPESETTLDGKAKPTILFSFGGGFIMGSRNSREYLQWFRRLCDNGYKVITIDYRLGLKGKGNVGVTQVGVIYDAIEAGVEDLYSATAFIIDNAEALGVDPAKIVISGSSAGAIISLQAEWHLCNGTGHAGMLPEGFRYAGVMAFSGAILSREGKIRFAKEPAPVLFFHGMSDGIVNYKKTVFFKNRFEGAASLSKLFAKKEYNYNIHRFEGKNHEIAVSFLATFPEQLRFPEENVIRGKRRIVDAVINDPSIKAWKLNSTKDIYKNN